MCLCGAIPAYSVPGTVRDAGTDPVSALGKPQGPREAQTNDLVLLPSRTGPGEKQGCCSKGFEVIFPQHGRSDQSPWGGPEMTPDPPRVQLSTISGSREPCFNSAKHFTPEELSLSGIMQQPRVRSPATDTHHCMNHFPLRTLVSPFLTRGRWTRCL